MTMLSKRRVYRILAVFMWAVIFDMFYDVLGIAYWNALASGETGSLMEFGDLSFSGRTGELIFILIGAAAGYRAGERGWDYIYIQDRRHKKYKLDW